MLNANSIGMTIIDNRNGAVVEPHNSNSMAPNQKQKKTSSVNSRTAKDNWKSL